MLPHLPLLLLLNLSWALLALTKTVRHNWNITWTTANPDGKFDRRVYSVNGKWPCPTLEVDKGDRVIITMHNGLGDRSTSIHFHGLFQNKTVHMDGPSGVTQCAVKPGDSIVYDFKVDQPGTYWYHDHNKGQYPDGLRGPIIVHDREDPHKDRYDEEMVLTLSDWYHEQMPVLNAQFLSYTNPTGAEPVPQSALMNDSQNVTFKVEPGKTYMIRMVNMAAFAAQYVWFEDHTFRVVELDGVYVEPFEAKMIYLTAAQRASVLLTTKTDASKNYAFVGSMDEDLFDQVPEGLNANVTGWLVYNENAMKPAPAPIDEFEPLDDIECTPVDKHPLLPEADHRITLDVTMDNLADGANYAFFNDITYVRPKVPTLFTALSAGKLADNATVYGYNTHAYVLKHMDVIEIVVNNNDPGKHPFHLHGHNFQVVYRSAEEAGAYVPGKEDKEAAKYPSRRDTVLAPPNGHVVIRFRADNPGVWLFHCHLEWHLVSGLVTTMVEAPTVLQKQLKMPEDHLRVCRNQGIKTEGNAAGNTKDLLDLTGENRDPGRLPAGFTPRGIVALVFSILAAFLGLAVVSWYGWAEIPVAPAAGSVFVENK